MKVHESLIGLTVDTIISEIFTVGGRWYLTGLGLDMMLQTPFEWEGCILPDALIKKMRRHGFNLPQGRLESMDSEYLAVLLEWVNTPRANQWLECADAAGGFYNLFETISSEPEQPPSTSPKLAGIYKKWVNVRNSRTPSDICFVEYGGYLYTFDRDIEVIDSFISPSLCTKYREFRACEIKRELLRALLYSIDELATHNTVFIPGNSDLSDTLYNFLLWENKKLANPDTTILTAFTDDCGLVFYETFGVDAEYINELLDLPVCVNTSKQLGVSYLKFFSGAMSLNELCKVKSLMVAMKKLDSAPVRHRFAVETHDHFSL